MQNTYRFVLKKIVGIAVFTALAYATTFVFHIPVSFLTFDAKDAVITIGAFIYGPLAAVVMSFLAALLELITISSTGLYGFLMNFIASAAFSAAAALLYKYMRTQIGSLLSLLCGAVTMVASMMVLNLLITPHYMGVSVAQVRELIPTLLFPFNLAKALLNAALVLFLYKPISVALRHAGLVDRRRIPAGKEGAHPAAEHAGFACRNTVIALLVAVATLAIALVLFFVYLGASVA